MEVIPRMTPETESQRIARLNKEILADAKRELSHGLNLLMQSLMLARLKSSYSTGVRETVTVYFAWVTDNRLSAHIIIDGELTRLNIPEAGYRLHASYKDGYQVNGEGYSKIDHVLDAMVYQVKKRVPVLVEGNTRIRAQLI